MKTVSLEARFRNAEVKIADAIGRNPNRPHNRKADLSMMRVGAFKGAAH